MANGNSRGRANLLIGVLLVGLGVLFLLGQLFEVNLWRFLWPFFVIVPGVLFFVGMVLGGRSAGPLAIPGSIVTTVGLLLLYQSVTNHWESWAYAWALIFPTSVGIGLAINGAWSEIESLKQAGRRWITVGLAIFLVAGVFFEVLVGISNNLVANIVWPGLLIAFGVYLLVRRGGRQGTGRLPAAERAPDPYAAAPQPPAAETRSEPTFEPLDIERK